jgi:2'-5' RNA ligase
MRFLAASTIALLAAASALAAPWIGNVPPPYRPLQATKSAYRLKLSTNFYRSDLVKFQSNSGPKPFQSWLQQTLDYTYVKPLFDQIQAIVKKPLKNRGEAHITVVTPPEFDQVLKPVGITMDDINRLANKLWIQRAEFKVKCVGRARTRLNNYENGDVDEVYFIVVESEDLLKIREEIQKMYISKGGEPALFAARAFWPHVTVGFTTRDMFLQDGVWKDTNACWADVALFRDAKKEPIFYYKANSEDSAEAKEVAQTDEAASDDKQEEE